MANLVLGLLLVLWGNCNDSSCEKESENVSCFAAAAAKSLQSCPTLCDPRGGSPSGSAVPGILQARTLEWVAISFSNAWHWKVKVKLLSRVRLSDPMDCSPPGSSVHGIFQARVLEWVANAFSELLSHVLFFCQPMDSSPPDSSVHEISQAREPEWVAISFSRGSFLTQGSNPGLHLSHQGSPIDYHNGTLVLSQFCRSDIQKSNEWIRAYSPLETLGRIWSLSLLASVEFLGLWLHHQKLCLTGYIASSCLLWNHPLLPSDKHVFDCI